WFGAASAPLDQAQWHDPSFRVLQMLRTVPDGGGRAAPLVANGALEVADLAVAPRATSAWERAWAATREHRGDAATADTNGAATPDAGHEITLDALSLRLYRSR